MYADDVTLCLQYNDPAQSLALQSNPNAFQTWSMDKELNLNGSKCKLMTFVRVSPQYSTYTLSGCVLDRITHADDFGVYMDPKLKFSDHITTMVNKTRGVLAFIKRWSKEFDVPYATKTLFI